MDTASLDTILHDATAGGVAPGASFIVVDRDQVVYEGAAGLADDNTVYRYASCTKALATVAILQQIERGALKLDTEVASVLPAFGELQVLDGFDGDTPRLRAPSRPPVVRELLTHSSGLSYFFTNAKTLRFHELTGTPHVLTGQMAALTQVPLANDPGVMWDYSTAVDWLGILLHELTGQDLAEYLAEHVTGPLGMVDTTFTPTDAQRARMFPIHARTEDGGLVPIDLELVPEPEFWAGGHGMFGTARDYGRFMRSLLRGGELDGTRILKEETVDLAFSDQLNGVPMPDGIISADKTLSNDVPALPIPTTWGLGFQLVQVDIPGMRHAGTGSWAGLFNLYYWIDRTAGVAGMWLTQVLPFFDARIVGATQQLEAAVYAGG